MENPEDSSFPENSSNLLEADKEDPLPEAAASRSTSTVNLSKTTFLIAAFLVSSGIYMRQVLNLFVSAIGRNGVSIIIWGMFTALALFIGFKFFRKLAPLSKLLFAAMAAMGVFYAAILELPEERMHLIEYGILGFFLSKDFSFYYPPKLFIPLSVFFCVGVSAIDEIIQSFLPYRVGDIRDIIFAALGGFWGAVTCYLCWNFQTPLAAEEAR